MQESLLSSARLHSLSLRLISREAKLKAMLAATLATTPIAMALGMAAMVSRIIHIRTEVAMADIVAIMVAMEAMSRTMLTRSKTPRKLATISRTRTPIKATTIRTLMAIRAMEIRATETRTTTSRATDILATIRLACGI